MLLTSSHVPDSNPHNILLKGSDSILYNGVGSNCTWRGGGVQPMQVVGVALINVPFIRVIFNNLVI